MTNNEQLLREALDMLEMFDAKDARLDFLNFAEYWRLRDAINRLESALAQPASQEQADAYVRSTTFGRQAEKLADDFLELNSLYVAALERITELESRHSQAQQPSCHIKEPFSVAEIKAKIASGDYSAEMMLQHAMLHLSQQSKPKPMTDEQMEEGRERIFSVNNPYCPCDRKTFAKVARYVERFHHIGITAQAKKEQA